MSTTTNLALNEPAYNSTSPTWDQPLNYNSTILDQMFGNTTSVSVNTGGSPTYTNIAAPSAIAAGSTSQAMRFNLTGALAANQTVLLPQSVAGMWVVTNSTSGAYTVTLGSNNGSNAAAGTTVALPQGYSIIIYSDGTNVKKADDGILQGGSISGNLTVSGSITAGTTVNSGTTVAAGTNITATTTIAAGTALSAGTTVTAGTSVNDSIGNVRSIPINSQTAAYVLVATDNGQAISITTGGVTIPNAVMSSGNAVTIYNNSGSSQTITQGTGVTLQWAGQASSTTGNRTLALYGICTVLFTSSSTAIISGAGLS